MPFLTIAGITVPVSSQGASQGATEVVGNESRAYAGSLRTTVRAEKRAWQFTTKTMSAADAAALVAAVAGGVYVAVAGDAIGSSISCRVTVTSAPFVQVAGGFRRTLALAVREV